MKKIILVLLVLTQLTAQTLEEAYKNGNSFDCVPISVTENGFFTVLTDELYEKFPVMAVPYYIDVNMNEMEVETGNINGIKLYDTGIVDTVLWEGTPNEEQVFAKVYKNKSNTLLFALTSSLTPNGNNKIVIQNLNENQEAVRQITLSCVSGM